MNLTSLVEFEHHLIAETIQNENEEKKPGYGDIDFKAYSMILGAFRGNPLKIRVLRSCSENFVQFL